jgi:hypothetical protein
MHDDLAFDDPFAQALDEDLLGGDTGLLADPSAYHDGFDDLVAPAPEPLLEEESAWSDDSRIDPLGDEVASAAWDDLIDER